MAWSKSEVQGKPNYTPAEIGQWDAILARRKQYQPACLLDGRETLDSLKKGKYRITQVQSAAGTVTMRWIQKPGAVIRLEAYAPSVGLDDRATIVEGLADAVAEMLKTHQAVYWYDAAPGQGDDGEIFENLAAATGASWFANRWIKAR